MFDAKSILEALVNGNKRPASSSAGSQGDPLSDLLGGNGGLGDLLRNALPQAGAESSSGKQGDPLSDLLGKLGGGQQRNAASDQSAGGSGGGFGGLGDLLGQLGAGSASSSSSNNPGQQKSITDVFGDILNQAKEGTKEGASKFDEATGASDKMGDLARQLSGRSPEELMEALKELISNNKLGAGAALGGLGALILGTQTGRSIAVNAAKLGALALIGGLAYKAYRNYQDGASTDQSAQGDIAEPPHGSGFEPDSVSNDDAILMVRTMIAAAAADGRIDANEQQRIIENLQGSGELDADAQEFLAKELNAPASVADIANAVSSKEQAAQVFAAARIAIDPDTSSEHRFLGELADRLNLDSALAMHIDAAARAS
ncbi:MAG: tellurite resistance TerB family protein [Filomicrobium sp.]